MCPLVNVNLLVDMKNLRAFYFWVVLTPSNYVSLHYKTDSVQTPNMAALSALSLCCIRCQGRSCSVAVEREEREQPLLWVRQQINITFSASNKRHNFMNILITKLPLFMLLPPQVRRCITTLCVESRLELSWLFLPWNSLLTTSISEKSLI